MFLPRTTFIAIAFSLQQLLCAQAVAPPPGGVLPSKEDVLSIAWEHPFVLPKGAVLENSVDLSEWFPPAGDQYAQASCGGWAVGYGLATYQWNRLLDRRSDTTYMADPANVFSPTFLYTLTISSEKISNCKTGIQLPDAIRLVCDTGCATVLQFPLDTSRHNCIRPIPDSVFVGAYRHRMAYPVSLDNFNSDQWKYHLGKGEPIVFFSSISEPLFITGYLSPGKPFIWQETQPTDWTGRVGHIMVCTGYKDNVFYALNSWGRNWGNDGYLEIPDSVLTWACSDAYVVRSGMALLPLIPMQPAALMELGGDMRLRGSLGPGEVHTSDSISYRVLDATKSGEQVIEVLDAGSLAEAHTIQVREDQPVTFHHEGDLYTFTWLGSSWRTGELRYKLVKNDRLQQAALKTQLETIDKHADGVIDGQW